MALTLWLLLVTVMSGGAVLAALTGRPARRAAGLIAATGAVAGLLVLLGLDLPAAVWLGLGGAAALLALPAGADPTVPRASRVGRLLVGVMAGLLAAIVYHLALRADWRPSPPEPVAGHAAVTGGRLLTADLALLLMALLLIAAVMLAASSRASGRER
jgi:hypothetical protein